MDIDLQRRFVFLVKLRIAFSWNYTPDFGLYRIPTTISINQTELLQHTQTTNANHNFPTNSSVSKKPLSIVTQVQWI